MAEYCDDEPFDEGNPAFGGFDGLHLDLPDMPDGLNGYCDDIIPEPDDLSEYDGVEDDAMRFTSVANDLFAHVVPSREHARPHEEELWLTPVTQLPMYPNTRAILVVRPIPGEEAEAGRQEYELGGHRLSMIVDIYRDITVHADVYPMAGWMVTRLRSIDGNNMVIEERPPELLSEAEAADLLTWLQCAVPDSR